MATTHPTEAAHDMPGLFSSWRGWVLAALLVGGVIVAALHWADVKRFGKLVEEAKPMWLLAAFGLQVGTYVGLAAQWWIALKRGRRPGRRRACCG
jgi:uncharacterized membrane protein YbhN (UPF0104 family)